MTPEKVKTAVEHLTRCVLAQKVFDNRSRTLTNNERFYEASKALDLLKQEFPELEKEQV
jgi:hypothetical protein